MYLLILSMQSGGEQAFEQYSSLQMSINDQNPLVIQEKQEVYTWLRDKLVNRVFVDPPCGDGVCENKGNDFPAVDRFGCSNDCGMFNRTTDIMFNFTAEFDKKGVNNMGFNICPQGAKDTSRCIFRKYMNDVQAKGVVTESVTANAQTVMFGGKQVPKLGWGWKGDQSRARNATYGDENLGANCRSSGEHSAIFCSLHCPERTTNVKIVGLSAPIRVGDENNRTREERPVSFRFNICADQHCLCGVWSCYFWGNLVVVLHN